MKELDSFDEGKAGRLHNVWLNMLRRCYKESTNQYHDYGGRGIFVTFEWHNFDNFLAWGLSAGFEIGLQLDRIDVDGNYEPNNCRFATKIENARNKRNNRYFEAFGESKILPEWAEDERCIVSLDVLRNRLYNYGWTDLEKALTTPASKEITKRTELFVFQNERKTLAQWAKDPKCAVPYGILYNRVIKDKWDIAKALTTPRKKDVEPKHGTTSRYWGVEYNCRCSLCKAAITEYNKQWQ